MHLTQSSSNCSTVLRWLCAFALALLGSAGSVSGQPISPERYCEATIVRRSLLRNERGHLTYVSPEAILSRDGDMLFAGQYSVEFDPKPQGHADGMTSNRLLAVIRQASGTVRTFPPFDIGDREISTVRAVSIAPGQWGVLVHAHTLAQKPSLPQLGTLWFAVLTANGWGAVERVPLPAGIQPVASLAKDMVVMGESVIAAAPADSAGNVSGVLIAERVRGVWRSRYVATQRAAYVAIALDGGTGELAIAVAKADVTRNADSNSLFLMYPDRKNDSLRLLVQGGRTPAHHPTMKSSARGLTLAWTALSSVAGVPAYAMQAAVEGGQLRRTSRIAARPAAVSTVSDANAMVAVARNFDADSVEVTLHALPAPSEGVRLTYRARFAEVVRATRASESEIAVAILATAIDGDHLIYEILWIRPRCAGSSRAQRMPDATSSHRSMYHVETTHSASNAAGIRKRVPH